MISVIKYNLLTTKILKYIMSNMFYNRFDSYYYSRPVSYRSYNTRIQKPEILRIDESDTKEVLNFLNSRNMKCDNLGGLSRGIRFDDYEVGKRVFNHHATEPEYFIRQWKQTNDLGPWHATGTHKVYHDFGSLMQAL